MTTFIVYNANDKDTVAKTVSSIEKVTNLEYALLLLKTEKDALERIVLSATTYTMILEAGDEVQLYAPMEYYDVVKPDSTPENEIRGLRIGTDVISNIKDSNVTFETKEDFSKWLSSLYSINNTELISVKLK